MLLESCIKKNRVREFGESLTANTEPSKRKLWACVETMYEPLQYREDIVRYSDERRRLTKDNNVVVLKLVNEAGNKKMINGGVSINPMVETLINLTKSVDLRYN